MTRLLDPGDVAPWFRAPLHGGSTDFGIDKMAGRHVLLLFLGSAGQAASAAALAVARRHAALFDDKRAVFFGITADPADAGAGRLALSDGIHFLLDYDQAASRLFGASVPVPEGASYRPHWLLLDPALRVVARFPLAGGERAVATLAAALDTPTADMTAPVLIVPNVLEPDFCAELIGLYERHGGGESGFMRQQGGQTVGMVDYSHKRRLDHIIEDEGVKQGLRSRLARRLIPMIERSYAFRVTRIERYIVACYDGADGGHFAAHRDNTTSATAHRRFATTINLNGDYEGGDLNFPEFGARTYRAPPGGAVVFSCSLLHEARRVTAGRRYATLPFLYDDAAAKVREANFGTLAGATGAYRADRREEPAAAS